ncbi:hypothetical protein HD806DRAFT_521201 [Xylariaceae sp. AK1471]|nr:hypothetical protein HD806DRAFT_521201 [Xylariaceae sp. AK1471]
MDPLSVAASVAGLLSAAATIHSLLEYISSAKNSPTSVRDAQVEVKHVELALRSLRRYLWRLDLVSAHRKELVSIDELIVSLADAMVAMSEFESFLQLLARLKRMQLSISWFRYNKRIEEHTAKAQRHKASLTMMLNIFQCESDLEASQSQERLQNLVEKILTENNALRTRMGQLEDSFDGRSTFSRHTEGSCTVRRFSKDDDQDDSSSSTSTIQGSMQKTTIVNVERRSFFRFAFEPILDQSRVYRRNENNECDRSFISSARQSRSWSVFSGYSLADISVLSVIAMPITVFDISNGRYYNPIADDRFEQPEEDIQQQPDSERKTSAQPASSSKNDFKHAHSSDSFRDRCLAQVNLNLDDNHQWPLWHKSIPKQVPLQDFASDSNSLESPTKQMGGGEGNQIIKTYAGSLAIGKVDNDDEELIPCKWCGQLLEEVTAFEIAGNRWHLNWLRCDICGFLEVVTIEHIVK